jgi:transcriptional regulator with XRE-family HTH domain
MFKINELRVKTGLSMRQVAIELGIPYTTYISYEKEDREPNSEMLIKLADYFNCSVDYLVGRNENNNAFRESFRFTEHEKEVIIGYRRQPVDVRNAIDTMLHVVPISEEKEKRA